MVDITRELTVFKEAINNASEIELKTILSGLQATSAQIKVDIQRLSSTRDLTGEARQYALADAHADKELTKKKIQHVQDLIGLKRKIKKGIEPPGFAYLKRFHHAAEVILPGHLLESVRAKAREIKKREETA